MEPMAPVLAGAATAGKLAVLAQEDSQLFLGEDFWPWMILAFGAAMVVGNVLALLRPPAEGTGRGGGPAAGATTRERPPLARSIVLIVVGLAAATWGIASLLA